MKKDNEWSTKHYTENKDRVTRTPLQTGGELGLAATKNVFMQ